MKCELLPRPRACVCGRPSSSSWIHLKCRRQRHQISHVCWQLAVVSNPAVRCCYGELICGLRFRRLVAASCRKMKYGIWIDTRKAMQKGVMGMDVNKGIIFDFKPNWEIFLSHLCLYIHMYISVCKYSINKIQNGHEPLTIFPHIQSHSRLFRFVTIYL